MKLSSSLVAVASAALFATSAHATSSVEVAITNFTATATGAFAWIDQTNGMGTGAQDQLGWATTTTPVFGDWVYNVTYSGVSNATSANGSSSTLTETGQGFFASLFTSATGGRARADLDFSHQFSLAGNSSVTFSWNRSISGVNTGQSSANVTYDYSNEMVVNTSGLVGDEWTGFAPVDANQSTLISSAFSLNDGLVQQSITFTNTSSDARITNFRTSFEVYSDGVVAAVPEPASMSVLLIGLVAIGYLLQRRHTKRRGHIRG